MNVLVLFIQIINNLGLSRLGIIFSTAPLLFVPFPVSSIPETASVYLTELKDENDIHSDSFHFALSASS